MTLRLKIILLAALVLIFVLLTRRVRKRQLDLRYTLSWYFLGAALMLLVLFPRLLTYAAHLIGIFDPMNMLFFCGFVFALGIIYTLTGAVSKQANEIRDLTQRMGLMEEERDRAKEIEASDRMLTGGKEEIPEK